MTAPSGPLSVTEVFVLLVAAAVVVAIVTRRSTLLPYSVALVVFGVAVAALRLPIRIEVGAELLLAVLLPGLVFEAAYRTDVGALWPNLPAVTVLAGPGVVITAAAVGVALHLGTGMELVLSFLVGTMLAATDPAAVIALFNQLRAPRRLLTLVEAESLFNDGTGIVIFVIALEALRGQVGPGAAVVGLVVSVAVATAVGVAVGFAASRVMAGVHDHLIELMISLVAAYGSYLIAARLGQSGLIATVVCGLVFGSYGRRVGMSRASEAAIDTVWEFIGFLLTTLVFLLIGLAISIRQLLDAAPATLLVVAVLVAARAMVVYGALGLGSRLLHRLRWAKPMPVGWLHVVAWSGLRGAVSVALALSLPADLPQRDLVQGIVFGAVLLTLLLQGTAARLVVEAAGVARDPT